MFCFSYLYKNIRSTLIFLSMCPIWMWCCDPRRELLHVCSFNVSSRSGNQSSNSRQRKNQRVKVIEGSCFKDLLWSWCCSPCPLAQKEQIFTVNCNSCICRYCHYLCHTYGCSKIFSKEMHYPLYKMKQRTTNKNTSRLHMFESILAH